MLELVVKRSIDKKFGWRSISLTDTGVIRQVNEDNFLHNPEQAHWAVADGMGGHQGGDVASEMIVENLKPLSQMASLSDFIDRVEDTLLATNESLKKLADSRNTVIGSTVVGAILFSGHLTFYWVGDSRAYLYRNGKLTQVTTDHTLVQELLERQEITPEQAINHPEKNVITRAIGTHDLLYIDYYMIPFEKGDKFLLCSDGVEKELPDSELEEYFTSSDDIEDIATQILSEVLDRGARDNVTLSIVEPIAIDD